jgi:urease accessory protein
VVLGDKLVIDAAVESGRALLTTPSAGRFYGVGTYRERQQQHVRLAANDAASLWWLPQETIVFRGANALLDTQIALAGEAELAWWDIVVLGCPASGQRFDSGSLEQRLRVCRDGQPLLEERVALRAGDRYANSPMGLGGASTFGMMVLTTGASEAALHSWLSDVNGADGEGAFSVTQRAELLIARYLGEDAAVCRHGFSALWRGACAQSTGVEPSEPRIWHT